MTDVLVCRVPNSREWLAPLRPKHWVTSPRWIHWLTWVTPSRLLTCCRITGTGSAISTPALLRRSQPPCLRVVSCRPWPMCAGSVPSAPGPSERSRTQAAWTMRENMVCPAGRFVHVGATDGRARQLADAGLPCWPRGAIAEVWPLCRALPSLRRMPITPPSVSRLPQP